MTEHTIEDDFRLSIFLEAHEYRDWLHRVVCNNAWNWTPSVVVACMTYFPKRLHVRLASRVIHNIYNNRMTQWPILPVQSRKFIFAVMLYLGKSQRIEHPVKILFDVVLDTPAHISNVGNDDGLRCCISRFIASNATRSQCSSIRALILAYPLWAASLYTACRSSDAKFIKRLILTKYPDIANMTRIN